MRPIFQSTITLQHLGHRALLCSAALLLSLLPIHHIQAQDILGDINHDRQFTIADVAALVDSLKHDSEPLLTVQDINGDGVVDQTDVEALGRFILTQGNSAYIAFSTDFECNAVHISTPDSQQLSGDQTTVTLSGQGTSHLQPGTHLIAVDPHTLAGGLQLTFDKIYDMYTRTVTITASQQLTPMHIDYLGDYQYSSFVGTSGFLGEGTTESPYLIHSKDDWKLLASKLFNQTSDVYQAFKTKSYKVVSDIDFGGAYLHPVGMNSFFQGTLDGDNHTLSNYRTETYQTFSGLIGSVGENAVIKNFNLQCAGMNCLGNSTTFGASAFIGVICAEEGKVLVDNIHVSGYQGTTITMNKKRFTGIGGVVGAAAGNCTISNCTNDLAITVGAIYTASTYQCSVGGIVGYAQDMDYMFQDRYITINRCRNNANITVTGQQDLSAGGIVGRFKDRSGDINPTIANCVNFGNISAGKAGEESLWLDDAMAGGIVGWMDSDGGKADPYIVNCLNTGNCYAHQCDSWAAGIVGYAYDDDTHIINCASTGNMTAEDGNAICAHGSVQSYCYSSNLSASTMNGNLSRVTTSSLPALCPWVTTTRGTLDIDLTDQ